MVRLGKKDQTPASSLQGAALTDLLHRMLLDASPYRSLHEARGAELGRLTAEDFVDLHLEQMAPRDPVERMLAIQMLWQHARIGRLIIQFESPCTDPQQLKGISAAIEAAMNTMRRQADAWRQLRERKLPSASSGANEKGSPSNDPAQTSVPADRRRQSEPAGSDPAHQPVEQDNGAAHSRWKGEIEPERDETRPALNGRARAGANGRLLASDH
jgi:hypothetical protein